MLNIETSDIIDLYDSKAFEEKALDVFRYQAFHNPVYNRYLTYLKVDIGAVDTVRNVPFLPIEFFKNQKVISGKGNEEVIFTSSGTTGSITSKHYVTDLGLYEKSFHACFELFYGKPSEYCFLALLPSYLEREGSSLIYMVQGLMNVSKHPDNGYYLHNTDDLVNRLKKLEAEGQKTILFGVTYALLDLAEKYKLSLKNVIIIETGGMKGKREEITRGRLHQILTESFGVKAIHSEYGMTELLSQAYSKGEGKYITPPWMKILIRDTYDPFNYVAEGKTGGVNIIDLANINSCAFIETKDLGKINTDGTFEVLGRFDHAEIRGCNLMINE
jgi:phenylacetate-coenzyme A ligase PaaK-like adenylate-forming protein